MTTYYQYIPVKPQHLDADGDPYSGGKLYFYEAGTSTPLTVYKTATGTAHSSPIVLDTQGRVPDSSGIFLPSGTSYKVILHDSNDTEVFSVDNLVSYAADGGVTFSQIQDMSANTVLGSIAGGTPEEISMTAAGRALMDDATAADQLVTLGITATAAEINYIDGVTSNLQTQIDTLTTTVNAKPTQLFGRVAANGAKDKGSSGWTVAPGATGYYTVTFDTAITEEYAVVVSAGPSASTNWGWEPHVTAESTTAFTVFVGDSETGSARNDVWSFILTYNPS